MAEKIFSAILAAGGSGTRFGGAVNKVYLPLCGQTVIGVSLDKLLHHPLVAEVIVVYRKEDEAVLMPILAEKGAGSGIPLLAVPGGDTRRDSVKKGLDLASSERVLVHDAARPFWDEAWIGDLAAALDEVPGASVAVLSPDTVKLADERGRVISTTERSRTWLVQTPQAFDRDILLRAHLILPDSEPVTDDCSMLEKLGYPVQLIPGSPKNRKITVPEDLEVSGSCQ
ncbi:MAG: 2-C-methyl-D-erythritol 4-phosphate cytidylyltransferase [Lachnospiraceae bacterium]|nr:2-C-methyl-D-erythritol 4-phosphate cytidylyltransferase [Lachnospiraceae bacterium]